MSATHDSLAWSALPADSGDSPEIACPSCRTGMDLHQPDLQRPERLLGTCRECGTWFLIDSRVGIIARLPDGCESRRE